MHFAAEPLDLLQLFLADIVFIQHFQVVCLSRGQYLDRVGVLLIVFSGMLVFVEDFLDEDDAGESDVDALPYS